MGINQEVTWLKNLQILLQQHGMKDNLYVLIQVFTIPPVPQGSTVPGSSNYENLGYTVFQVNNADGSLRFGMFEQSLYKPPINLFKQEA